MGLNRCLVAYGVDIMSSNSAVKACATDRPRESSKHLNPTDVSVIACGADLSQEVSLTLTERLMLFITRLS